MNPFDELSIEEAVRIRERKNISVTDILAVSAGVAKCSDVLRTAMAMGADRSIHVEVNTDKDGDLEPLSVAKLLKAIVEKEDRNLVILGKQSIDDDCMQTGQMLAGLLGWPQATSASKVDFEGENVTVTREVDGGVETLRAKLPMIITTDLRLNEPRYASLPNIMKAKKKKMEKKTLADYGVDDRRRLKTVKVMGMCTWRTRSGSAAGSTIIDRLTLLCRTSTAERRRESSRRGWYDSKAEGAWCNMTLCQKTTYPPCTYTSLSVIEKEINSHLLSRTLISFCMLLLSSI